MSTRISGLLFNVGEKFPCQCEDGNRAGPFAVAVVRGEAMVGQVPKKTSVCALYLCQGLGRASRGCIRHLFYSQYQTVLWCLC